LKIGSAIFISTILGALIGFGISYLYFNIQIQIFQNQLSVVNNNFFDLNSTINIIEEKIYFVQDNLTITKNNLNNARNDIQNLNSSMNNYESVVNIFQEDLTSFELNLSDVSSTISDLNSSLENLDVAEWHEIESLSGTSDEYHRLQFKGEELKIYWFMVGQTPNSWIEIKIYDSNGTLWQEAGSSGVYGVFEKEMVLNIPGEYSIWIRVSDVDWWKAEFLEYY
jgi:prefoldin subunit 5